jgi:transcriptional regulator with XRE-family HTH domain
MRLGFLIRLSRELRGWTLRELEERSGISNALISQIETGRISDPSWHRVVKIARALHLKLDRCAKCGK